MLPRAVARPLDTLGVGAVNKNGERFEHTQHASFTSDDGEAAAGA